MDAKVEDFDHEWHLGDRERAKRKAVAYVAAHAADLAVLEKYTREELISLVSQYRQAGREEDRIIADMWLLARYDPQEIAGSFRVGGSEVVAAAEAQLKEGRT